MRPSPRPAHRLTTAALATALLALAACTDSTGPGATSDRITALPRAVSGAERVAIDANTDFGLRLLRTLADSAPPDSNVTISPLSVSTALAMTLNGARDSTAAELRRALGFATDDMDAINAGYRDLLPMLARLDRRVQYTLANSVWADAGFPLVPAFLPTLRSTFDAQVFERDLQGPGTLGAVNGWVSDRTRGLIPTILDEVRENDVMYLVNAIHFKGDWRAQFDRDRTRPADFRLGGGRTVPVSMMQAEDVEFRTGTVGTTRVLELPYGGDAWVMTILMPAPGTLPALVASLDTAAWSRHIAALAPATGDTHLELPRFRTESRMELRPVLRALGVRRAVTPLAADFTGISPLGRQLYINRVRHRVFVDVNEEGTEAAAATLVGVGLVCACVTDVRIDAPFLWAIRERHSGTILFLGTMTTPPAP